MPVVTEKTARLSVEVPESVKGKLKDLAAEQERSVHFLMKRAINEYLSREFEKKALKKILYDEAEEAVEHYSETGLHLTHAEVVNWLNSYKTGHTAKAAPKCHK